MAEFLVTPSELKKWAIALEFEKEETLPELIARMQMLGNTARPTFLGEHASQFLTEYDELLQDLEKCNKKLSDLCTELNNIAGRFEAADRA